jgi:hypothetical protein
MRTAQPGASKPEGAGVGGLEIVDNPFYSSPKFKLITAIFGLVRWRDQIEELMHSTQAQGAVRVRGYF